MVKRSGKFPISHFFANFRHSRNHMSTEAAEMYVFSLIISHINYCLPTWATGNSTTLNPVISLCRPQNPQIKKKKDLSILFPKLLKKIQITLKNYSVTVT